MITTNINDPYYYKVKNVLPEIKERPAFQVGNRLFRTKNAAAKNVAWSWILTKYCASDLSQTKRVLNMVCKCMEDEVDQAGWEGCSLHDRKHGYFAKLHERVARYILSCWK